MTEQTFSYAGFWRRFVAFIIDMIIFSFILAIYSTLFASTITTIPQGMGDATAAIFSIVFALTVFVAKPLYFALFESSRFQATPGKMVLLLKVTDMKGRRVSFARSFGRNICKYISGLIFFIGYIMAGLTQKKQALHDKLMDCLVIRKVD